MPDLPAVRQAATVLGLALAVLGLVGVVSPFTLLSFGRSIQTTTALYVIAALRVVFGIVLYAAASGSRLPRVLRAIGIVVVVAGVLTPFFGVQRSEAVLGWLSGHGPMYIRAWAAVAAALGLFVVFATRPARPRG